MGLTCPQETDSAVKVLLLRLTGYFVQRFLNNIAQTGLMNHFEPLVRFQERLRKNSKL
jgi:hypothetical protein